MNSIFLSVIYFSFQACIASSSFCFWNSGCPYKYFANKTPYNVVRGDIRDSKIQIKDCEPVSIWAVYRHGKRYPKEPFARYMSEALVIRDYIAESCKKAKCSLCAQDVENLINWPLNKNFFSGSGSLTEEGHQEMLNIAKRLKVAFPNLLTLQQGQYTFRPAACSERIEDSVQAYIKGISDKELDIENARINDVMVPFQTCEKYMFDVRENPKTYDEAEKFQKSSEFLVVKDRIKRRTGIEYDLTTQNITALYDLCRFTWSAIENKASPWCALFTSEDLQVLEYIDDLKLFYRNGYGNPINQKFGRITLADLLRTFQEGKSGSGKKITAYFAHSTVIDMTLSAFGLFKDKQLLSGSRINKNRKWRSARSTFSTNIMAVLSKCNKKGNVDYNIVFYLNEEPIKSICDEGICPWKEFEDKLQPFLDTKVDLCEMNNTEILES